MLINIRRKIVLSPEYFDSKIKTHIFEKIKEETQSECSRENGYIISVKKLEKIISNSVSPTTSETVFDIVFKADVIKPEPGKEFEAVVCMIFSEGLLAEVKNKLKVFVPSYTLEDCENPYEISDSKLVNSNKTIEKGDTINIIITSSKYIDGGFSSVARLKE